MNADPHAWRGGLLSLAIVVSAGCAAYPKTKPVTAYDLSRGYRFETLASGRLDADRPRPEDELFVVLAFSGGGTRAAALSYGVLDELRRVKIRLGNQERRLLDEVDVISSVSGGSFTAAYYALRGEAIFDTAGPFHTRFLKYPVQRDLFAHAVYRPQNWQRLRSRVEIAANEYARNIFAGETFASLEGRKRPYIVLNATDMSTGARFEFTQDQFDLLCADLSKFPIARAVAASSAFPGLLNSMTIDNLNDGRGCYAGPGTAPDDWVANAEKDRAINLRRYRAAQDVKRYLDPAREHLHLLDGGLADNIGIRGPLYSLGSHDVPQQEKGDTRLISGWSVRRLIALQHARHVMIIVVNARTNRTSTTDLKAAGPGTFGVLGATSGLPMGNYTTESLHLIREFGRDAFLNTPGEPSFHVFEVAFESIADPSERAFFGNIGTNFELDPFEVDCLIDRGSRLLRESQSESLVKGRSFVDVITNDFGGTLEPPPAHGRLCNQATGRGSIGPRTHFVDVGPKYGWLLARSGDARDDSGAGFWVRLVKPNGWGVSVGYGSHALDVAAGTGGDATLGRAALRTPTAGVLFSRHLGRLEASAGVSVGYGFGAFDVDVAARDEFGRAGAFDLHGDVTNTWVVEPHVGAAFNVHDKVALMTSVGYVRAKPTLQLRSSTGSADRRIDLSAVRISIGAGYKLF